MATCYSVVIAESITETDWIPGYQSAVSAIVERHGGRYLARGAGDGLELLEGERNLPAGIVLVEWPDKAAAEAFFADPDYAPHRSARLAGTSGVSYLVEDR